MKTAAQRSQELTLEAIRADAVAATRELNELLSEKAKAKEELASLRNAFHSETVAMEERRGTLQGREQQVSDREQAFESDAAARRTKLSGIEQEAREASKELARLNGWIASAREDEAVRRGAIEALDAEIARKEALAKDIIALKDECAREERRRDELRLDNSLAVEDALTKLRSVDAEAQAAEKRTLEALDLTAGAFADRDAAIKQKERIQSDLEICVRRIEEKYEEAFPGLRMTF